MLIKGEKLFGEVLNPLLIENKDKWKVLLSNKDSPKKSLLGFVVEILGNALSPNGQLLHLSRLQIFQETA